MLKPSHKKIQSAWALAGIPCFNFSFELRKISFIFKRMRY